MPETGRQEQKINFRSASLCLRCGTNIALYAKTTQKRGNLWQSKEGHWTSESRPIKADGSWGRKGEKGLCQR